MFDPKQPIRRSRHDAMIAGVCSGLAAWAGWDPSVIRVLYILVTVFTGFLLGFVAYAALWVFLPSEPTVVRVNAQPAHPGAPVP